MSMFPDKPNASPEQIAEAIEHGEKVVIVDSGYELIFYVYKEEFYVTEFNKLHGKRNKKCPHKGQKF